MITKKLFLFSFKSENNKKIINLFNCLNQYSTNSNKTVASAPGKQNVFYFTKSKLLNSDKLNELESTKLYGNIPVVFLLGWTGAKDQHLTKYANIYASMGYHTVRFSPSNKLTFFEKMTHKSYAFKLLDLMKNEYKLTNNKIFIHIFSNAAGFIIYHHMLNIKNGVYNGKEFNNKDYEFMTNNLCGFIGDSNFGWSHNPYDLFNGISNLLENQLRNKLVRALVSSAVVATYELYRLATMGKDYFSNALEVLLNDDLQIPFLFMYSKVDKLISPLEIQKFIDEKKRRNPNQYIKTVVYDDAEHVLLYAKYPEDYVKHINEHLKLCRIDLPTVLNRLNIDKDKIDLQLGQVKPKLTSNQ